MAKTIFYTTLIIGILFFILIGLYIYKTCIQEGTPMFESNDAAITAINDELKVLINEIENFIKPKENNNEDLKKLLKELKNTELKKDEKLNKVINIKNIKHLINEISKIIEKMEPRGKSERIFHRCHHLTTSLYYFKNA